MEWQDDTRDPFENALAKRNRLTTTQAESQAATTEGEETHTLCHAMKKLETGGGQQDSKAPHYCHSEEREQDKKLGSNTLQQHYSDNTAKDQNTKTLQDHLDSISNDQLIKILQDYSDDRGKKHSRVTLEDYITKVLQDYSDGNRSTEQSQTSHDYLGDSEGKNDGRPHHTTSQGEEKASRILRHYTEEDQDIRTLQDYTDEEEKNDRALQHCPYEEDSKSVKAQHYYLGEEEDRAVKANEERDCSRILKQYPYKEGENDGRTMHKYSFEDEEKNLRAQNHYLDEEEEREDRAYHHSYYKEEEKSRKTAVQYPYGGEEKKCREHYLDEEGKEDTAHHHYLYDKEEKDEKTTLQYIYVEQEKSRQAHHLYLDEEEGKENRVRHQHLNDEEDRGGKTKVQYTYVEQEKSRHAQHLYLDEERKENGTHRQLPYKEEEDRKTMVQYPNVNEEKNHYPREEVKEDKVHQYLPKREEIRPGKTQPQFSLEEEEKKGKTPRHYLDDKADKDGRTVYRCFQKERVEVVRRENHYRYEEENNDGGVAQHDTDDDEGDGSLHHHPFKREDGRALLRQSYEDAEKYRNTHHHYPQEKKEENGRTLQHYPVEEKEEDDRTLQRYPYKEKGEDDRALQRYPYEEKEVADGTQQRYPIKEKEKDDRTLQQNPSGGDIREKDVKQQHHTSEGQDGSMHTSDQHNQLSQGQAWGARGGYQRRRASRGPTVSWRNRHATEEDDGYGSPQRHQYMWTHRSHPYPARGHWAQGQGHHYSPSQYYINSSHYPSAWKGAYAGSAEEKDEVLKPEELVAALVECSSFRSTFMNLLDYNYFEKRLVQQVAEAHPKVFHIDRNGVQLQPQIKLCQAYPSSQGCPYSLSCQDLHVCNTFVCGWCSDKHCSLGHSFYTDHNKAILETFCLASLPPHRLMKLLKHVATATTPPSSCLDVCRGYNRGQCDADHCHALHLCLSFVVGRGRCKQPFCRLNHNPNTPGCSRLLTAHGISVNETVMDILVALLSDNSALARAGASVPSIPARAPNTQASYEDADSNTPSNFLDLTKQKLKQRDNSSTRKAIPESSPQRESATHYKSDKASSEFGAVGGQKSNKSSNDDVSQKQRGNQSSSDRDPGGRTEDSQRAVWAYHRQGNVAVSEICRFSVESACLKEDKGCSRLHASRPFHWQVCDSKGHNLWLNLPGTIITCLETAFCDPAQNGVKLPPLNPSHLRRLENVLDQDSWYANFEAMVLTNSDCSKVTALQRLCIQSGAAAPYSKSSTHIWYFCDINGRWMKYGQADTSGQADRESSITSADIESHYQAGPNVPLYFKISQFTYVINFAGMTETNQTTNVQRAVRRRPELYVDASAQETSTGTRASGSVHTSK